MKKNLPHPIRPSALRSLASLLILPALCVSLNASTTVTWDFEDSNTPRQQGIVSGDDASLITADDAEIGPGLVGGFSGTTKSTFAQTISTTDSEAGAVSGDDYFEFSFSLEQNAIDAGYTFNVESLSFLVGASTGANNHGTFTITQFLRTNAESTDYTTTLGSDSVTRLGTPLQTTIWADNPVNIVTSSNPDFSGLTSLTFRIYQYDDKNANDLWGRTDYVIADITVIPEPTTFGLLLALGSLGLVIARRARRT